MKFIPELYSLKIVKIN